MKGTIPLGKIGNGIALSVTLAIQIQACSALHITKTKSKWNQNVNLTLQKQHTCSRIGGARLVDLAIYMIESPVLDVAILALKCRQNKEILTRNFLQLIKSTIKYAVPLNRHQDRLVLLMRDRKKLCIHQFQTHLKTLQLNWITLNALVESLIKHPRSIRMFFFLLAPHQPKA